MKDESLSNNTNVLDLGLWGNTGVRGTKDDSNTKSNDDESIKEEEEEDKHSCCNPSLFQTRPPREISNVEAKNGGHLFGVMKHSWVETERRNNSHISVPGWHHCHCIGGSKGDDASGTRPYIGIDIGTTYSCVTVWHNRQAEVFPNEQGNCITPSYVGFCKDGT
eukprot:7635916-Ditylum_brightwellii.AAC.1